jgi:hypothetical protein
MALFVLAAPGPMLLADPPPQSVVDLFTEMASALSESNAAAFLKPIDRAMKDYQKLESYIVALTAQAEVQSSIEFLTDEGDEQARTVGLDWFLELRSRQATGPLERRRERVTCQLARVKKSWKIKSLDPVELFRPPGAN